MVLSKEQISKNGICEHSQLVVDVKDFMREERIRIAKCVGVTECIQTMVTLNKMMSGLGSKESISMTEFFKLQECIILEKSLTEQELSNLFATQNQVDKILDAIGDMVEFTSKFFLDYEVVFQALGLNVVDYESLPEEVRHELNWQYDDILNGNLEANERIDRTRAAILKARSESQVETTLKPVA